MTKKGKRGFPLGLLLIIVAAVVAAVAYSLFRAPEEAAAPLVAPTLEAAAQPEASDETAAVEAEDSPVESRRVYTIDPAKSEARFIIEEVLRNQDTTVVGTTQQVAGQIAFDMANPQSTEIGEILINARTLTTDNSFRNRAIANRILLTDQYEIISFTPSQINGLPETAEAGQSYTLQVVGQLSIIGQSREVTFDVEVTPGADSELSGLATTTLRYADFGITIPAAQAVQAVAEEVTLQLEFTATSN